MLPWVLCFILPVTLGSDDENSFIGSLTSLKGQGVLISSKARISIANSQTTLNLNDYFWLNETNFADSDLFLDYSSDSKFHRVVVTPNFGGVFHSAVGYSTRLVSSRRYPYSLLRNKSGKRGPMFDRVTEFSSDCNATKKDARLFNYAKMPDFYPKVKISGPSAVYPLSMLLLVNTSSFQMNSSNSSIGSSKYKLLRCNNCSSSNLEVTFGFPVGSETKVDNLQYARVSFVKNEVKTTAEYFIHKIEILENQEMRKSGEMQPQDGVFCDFRAFEKPMEMKWPSHLSLSSEWVQFKNKRVSFVDEWYDYDARLLRLDIRGPRLTVNVSETPSENVEYASMVLDFNSQLAFVRDLEDSNCKITTHRKLNFLKHVHSDTSTVVAMAHPLDAYDFNETMNFKGYCEDSFGVPGKLYFSKAAEDNELCVADDEKREWSVAGNLGASYYVPMWLADYASHSSKNDVNENSHQFEQRTNFMDVSNRKALHDVFDVSGCFKGDHVSYYALLAVKETSEGDNTANEKENISDVVSSNYTVCMSTDKNKSTRSFCESIDEENVSDKGLDAVYIHVVSRYLASVMEVYSTRISYVALNDKAPQFSVIAFALLDFAGISDINSVNKRKEMRSNKRVIAASTGKLTQTFFVSLKVQRKYKNDTEKAVLDYTDVFEVISVNEISGDTYELILTKGKITGHSHLMLIMMISVGIIMILVGASIGVAIAYKLWRGATSFGYMIHSNLS